MRYAYSCLGVLSISILILGCVDSDTDTFPDIDAGLDGGEDADSDTITFPQNISYSKRGVCNVGGESSGNFGYCIIEGSARVTRESYIGVEEHLLTADDENGEDLCRVRFQLTYVGGATVVCDECIWALTVEASHVEILADVNEACATSDLGLDAAALAELEGKHFGYGYATGGLLHDDTLMKLDEDSGMWYPFTYMEIE